MTTKTTLTLVTGFVLAGLALGLAPERAEAQCFGFGFSYAAAPVVVAPAPVYVAPAPVYVAPAPVYYYAPSPHVYRTVCYPTVRYAHYPRCHTRYSYGGHRGHRGHSFSFGFAYRH